MFRLIKWAAMPVLAVAMMGLDAPQAKAIDGFRVQIGGLGISSGYRSYRPSYGYHRGYSSGYGSHYGGHHYGGIHYGGIHYGGHHYGGHHYARPHYDYHSPSLVPHRGHLDYVPGHYDLHYGHHGHRGHYGH